MHINRKRQSESQTALDAQSSAREAQPTRRPFGAFSLQRVALACFGVLGTGSLLALAGCPANLEDPQRFDQAGGASAGGASAGGGSSVVAAGGCVTDAFKAACITCHAKAGGPLSAGLDLESDNVAARLVGVSAMHLQADATMCSPAKLIDPAMPAASWLLAKINGTQMNCGAPMPLSGTALTDVQKACITAFVMSEASSGAAPAGAAGAAAGGAAAGGAATATGGAATAGSGGM